MKYNYKNRKELNERYLHDSSFRGYCYDYDKREIRLSCIDGFRENTINLCFSNVIFAEMQSCQLWSPGSNDIYDIWVEEESIQMKHLKESINLHKAKYDEECLVEEVDYIQIKIQIISGDTLFVVCEELEWLEERLCD